MQTDRITCAFCHARADRPETAAQDDICGPCLARARRGETMVPLTQRLRETFAAEALKIEQGRAEDRAAEATKPRKGSAVWTPEQLRQRAQGYVVTPCAVR